MTRVEIWASGSGTNADAICSYFQSHPKVEIGAIRCNRKQAGVFSVAERHGVNAVYFGKDDWNYSEIIMQLKQRKIDFIVLAGFLKLVPAEIIKTYNGKIINIHPSLLPKYGGKNMYGEHVHNAVLADNELITGITIHEVNEEFDKGKILAQYSTPLSPKDGLYELKTKIQQLEHTHFAPTIEAWIQAKS